ncbi:HNH endonuclease [Microvirga tunisiensis]|uniref:HNH endonuclease n=1 Tax=Microvirga tunisiensis TaxID=2108360 RepID=A0A5N7MRN6_9HYPH|nr:HNH endonuclease [Microvirga tunisiensis]MPR11658.1 HNH endonuclease [Microvirga tunisiensis]MPR29662.1 HNH endonuclease [Microvirga tunisiensis]
MKLPNFFDFAPLNAVKEKMGIPRDVYGDLTVHIDAARLSEFELERLTSTDGLDVTLDEIRVLEDGTLAFKTSRVLLYIRDVADYGHGQFQPRYHVAECATLLQMKEKKKFNRYVVSTRTDGRFTLNVIKSSQTHTGLHNLSVCQNCLDKLRFHGFAMQLSSAERKRRVTNFLLSKFFEQYPVSLHLQKPRFDEDNAPRNNYTDDFGQISQTLRVKSGWRCIDCNINLSDPAMRQYLHVHHRNALKWDNDPRNLEVLCIRCHANKPDHSHIKNDARYYQFLRIIDETATVLDSGS